MRGRVVYLPSDKEFVKRLLRVYEPSPGVKILDLGSGDGRILESFLDKYSDIKAFGVEINPNLVSLSRRRLSRFKDIAQIKLGNMYNVNLSDYDVVYTYLTRNALFNLRPNINKLLSSGGILIAHDYPVPGIRPSLTDVVDLSGKKHYIFIYFDKDRVKKSLLKGLRI